MSILLFLMQQALTLLLLQLHLEVRVWCEVAAVASHGRAAFCFFNLYECMAMWICLNQALR